MSEFSRNPAETQPPKMCRGCVVCINPSAIPLPVPPLPGRQGDAGDVTLLIIENCQRCNSPFFNFFSQKPKYHALWCGGVSILSLLDTRRVGVLLYNDPFSSRPWLGRRLKLSWIVFLTQSPSYPKSLKLTTHRYLRSSHDSRSNASQNVR